MNLAFKRHQRTKKTTAQRCIHLIKIIFGESIHEKITHKCNNPRAGSSNSF